MKKYYKILSLIMAVIMIISAMQMTASAETHNNLTYSISNNEVSITGCDKSATTVTIPTKINGYPVTRIHHGAFDSCSALTKVIIPDSITSIGDFAFQYCISLTSVTIPNSVTNIGTFAFYHCKALKNIILPDSISSISNSAFIYCSSLTNITIPDSVTSIETSAFESCTSLTSITIPTSVTNIGNSAFKYCTSLTSITIPANVTSIGTEAFAWCSSLISITVDKNNENYSNDEYGVLFNKNKTELIQYPINNTRTSYIIPNGVTSIGNSAFSRNDNLKNIAIPDTVTDIGQSAFSDCVEIKNITLPKNVQILKTGLFNGCKKLSDITIPESVTAIYWDVFYYCTSLEYICIPENVKEIKGNPFGLCYNLKSIEVDDGNEYFCSKDGVLFTKDMTELIAYPGAKSDTSYTIPEPVSEIREFCFHGISNLEKLGIPVTVKEIGNIAFSYHQNMILDLHIYYDGNAEQWNNIRFADNNTSEHIKFTRLHYNCYPVKEYSEEISPGKHYEVREITYTCECGFSYKDQTTPTPHVYNTVKIVLPSCENYGYTTYYCECGESYETDFVDNLGHNFGEWEYNGKKSTRTCTRCKSTESIISTPFGDVEIESAEQTDNEFTVNVIIPGGEEYIIIEGTLEDILDYNFEIVKVFDINLENKDGVHVQPDGTVKVKLPNDWTNDTNYNVYRVNDDGSITNMEAYREGSHMVFDTNHFSIYVIIEKLNTEIEMPEHTSCSHICHKTGFLGFFAKIAIFFWKLFGTNPVCECGMAHY